MRNERKYMNYDDEIECVYIFDKKINSLKHAMKNQFGIYHMYNAENIENALKELSMKYEDWENFRFNHDCTDNTELYDGRTRIDERCFFLSTKGAIILIAKKHAKYVLCLSGDIEYTDEEKLYIHYFHDWLEGKVQEFFSATTTCFHMDGINTYETLIQDELLVKPKSYVNDLRKKKRNKII